MKFDRKKFLRGIVVVAFIVAIAGGGAYGILLFKTHNNLLETISNWQHWQLATLPHWQHFLGGVQQFASVRTPRIWFRV
jgi:hypothetical protein